MKAALLENQAPGGARTPLEEKLPLSTPYVLQFFPIYACNFVCKYCHFSIEKEKRCFVTDRISMSMDLYKKCVNDIAMFPEKIRTLRFVGMGEPLMHRNIAEMVHLAKLKNIANRVEILTNGSLLNQRMTNNLVAAGLDRLVISLQGVSARAYKEVSGIDLDFDHFVEQIAYFYAHKGQTHMHLKVVDIALHGEDDRQKYFSTFGDICDSIGIESAVPIFPDVAYNSELEQKATTTQFGTNIIDAEICPQPFYTLQINPDGKVVGCYSVAYPEILGDCNHMAVKEIWNGKKYNSFRKRMLRGRKDVCIVCRECNIKTYRMQTEDAIYNKNGRLNMVY
jgi:Predicted Fe-S oxidoreductases